MEQYWREWARGSVCGGVGSRVRQIPGSWLVFSAHTNQALYQTPEKDKTNTNHWPRQIIVQAKYSFQLPPSHLVNVQCVVHTKRD